MSICVDTTIYDTGWRRPIRCLKLQVIFRKRTTNNRALLRKMTYQDKASYGSSPPCPIGCLICVGDFLQKSPVISGSFAKRDMTDLCACVMPHICKSHVTYMTRVTPHICMSHVTHVKHTRNKLITTVDMPHVCMSHVTHMDESRTSRLIRRCVTHVYEQVMSLLSRSHDWYIDMSHI